MKTRTLIAVFSWSLLTVTPLAAQSRPDFSGAWRLDNDESHRIGDTAGSSNASQVTWLIDHRDPEINVVVNVRDLQGSHEFSFRCTTDGQKCVNELPSLKEVRRMTATWEKDVLVMFQRAQTPHGGFQARDRLSLIESGERLVFDRVVTNEQGDRHVRQVFRKLND